MLSDAKIAELRAAAENVQPPGPWHYSPWHIEEGPSCVRRDGYGIVATVASDNQADFLSRLDPQTILALLDEIETLKTALRAMLNHSCVADSYAEDKDADDHEAERLAHRALSDPNPPPAP